MTQISVYISDESKALFEEFSKRSDQKKGFIVEQALLQYISAQQELPRGIMIPPAITVTKEVFDTVIVAENEPTEALVKLMHEDRD